MAQPPGKLPGRWGTLTLLPKRQQQTGWEDQSSCVFTPHFGMGAPRNHVFHDAGHNAAARFAALFKLADKARVAHRFQAERTF